LFRIEDIHSSLAYLSAMFSSRADSGAWRPDKEFLFVLFLAAAFSFCTLSRLGNKLQQSIFFASYSLKQHFAMTLVSLLLCIISAGYLTSSAFNPFIYFRF
jgi:hypothetical protein